jgi:hypothetical protein
MINEIEKILEKIKYQIVHGLILTILYKSKFIINCV